MGRGELLLSASVRLRLSGGGSGGGYGGYGGGYGGGFGGNNGGRL